MEIRKMNRKWLVFPLSAGALLAFGLAAGPGLYGADDETPLGKIMEQVNKHNSTITKGTRTKVAYAKDRKNVEKSAKELYKLAKEAKPIKDAIKKAKAVADPQKQWDVYMDEFIKSSEKLGEVSGKAGTTFEEAKSAFTVVKKACADCHKDFRVEEGSF
jgi:cytochrome c556